MTGLVNVPVATAVFDVVEVTRVVVVETRVDVVVVVGRGVVVADAPLQEAVGRHWEYQSFTYLQHASATQVVPPVYPIPPPIDSKN